MARRTRVILVLVPFVLAGCVGDSGLQSESLAVSQSSGEEGVPGVPAEPGARPNWTHGDWFAYRMYANYGFGTLINNLTAKLVVIKATGSGYELAADQRNFGVVDAHFNSFFIGPLTRDLAGEVSDKRFAMFQWPLKEGATWQTEFSAFTVSHSENQPARVEVMEALDVDGPQGQAPGFRMLGRSPAGFTFEYEYSSAVKWIMRFVQKDPTGRVMFSMNLVDAGPAYTGKIHVVTREVLLEQFAMMPPFQLEYAPVPPARQFSVQKDFTFVQEIFVLIGFAVPPAPGAAVIEVAVVYPDHTNRVVHHAGPAGPPTIQFRDIEPPQRGTYTVEYMIAGTGGLFVGYYGFVDTILEFTAQSHAHH